MGVLESRKKSCPNSLVQKQQFPRTGCTYSSGGRHITLEIQGIATREGRTGKAGRGGNHI